MLDLKKPTLLVTTSTFPRWQDDSEPRFVYDLSQGLTAQFNIIVLAPHTAGAAHTEYWHGMQVYRYRYAPEVLETLAYTGGITANLKQNRWKIVLLPLFFLGQWWAIRKLLKQYSIHAIHAHWLIPQGLIAALALWGKASTTKLICTSHGGDLFGLRGSISTCLKRWVISRCYACTVVSQAMLPKARELIGQHAPALSVIPMGTDLSQIFIPNPQIPRLPKRLLFVGRLVEKKGLSYLLQALAQLLPNQPDLELVIAGSGNLQTELIAQAKQLGITQQVNFLGRLTHNELVNLYQSATLAVFPFIQAKDGDMEGLGLVMVEAMGCGCPVIASDLPAIRDVIHHSTTGYLVEPANSAALAQAIQTVLEQAPLRQKLSAQALQYVQHHFDWQTIVQRYQTVLNNSIDNSHCLEAAHAH